MGGDLAGLLAILPPGMHQDDPPGPATEGEGPPEVASGPIDETPTPADVPPDPFGGAPEPEENSDDPASVETDPDPADELADDEEADTFGDAAALLDNPAVAPNGVSGVFGAGHGA